jgi:two-component system chemotaxis response regulator CheB
VLIAPGGFHLELERQGLSVKVVLHEGPPENSCRPAVDVLFRSAASVFGAGCLAVVLTGMGKDGLRGSERVVHAGGGVIAQDEATSVVWGMPRAVTEAGLANWSLPLASVAQELLRATAQGRRMTVASRGSS